MTDPEFADATYVEPLTVESVTAIIEKGKTRCTLLPTLGGQTGLNLSLELHAAGILDKYGVEMIGAKPAAIKKGEDREPFQTGDAGNRSRCSPFLFRSFSRGSTFPPR